MPRSIWKGVITFGLVSIPVQLFSATQDKDVNFHLLHQRDHGRIKFKRFCSIEDREVEQDELVRAYEVRKDQYVEVTDEDLERLPLPAKRTIQLSSFVKSDEIDPIYYDKSYYLEPEETGLKPYALLLRLLEKKGVTGVATVAIRNKESLCALRPQDGTLLLETLFYPDELRERDFTLPNVLVNDRELAVASTLVDALAEPFDPSKYHDRYREALLELIASKSQGREVVVPEGGAETAPTSDLMAALRASIEAARKHKGGASDERGGARSQPSKSSSKPASRAPSKAPTRSPAKTASSAKPARRRTHAA